MKTHSTINSLGANEFISASDYVIRFKYGI